MNWHRFDDFPVYLPEEQRGYGERGHLGEREGPPQHIDAAEMGKQGGCRDENYKLASEGDDQRIDAS